MHIDELTLINFQSHVNTVLHFTAGFNCLIGRTRSGKSSTVRALMWLYFDVWSDSYIRKGADFAQVILRQSDGITISRSKGPNVNLVDIVFPDGSTKHFEKFGTDAPPEVKSVLRVAPIRIDVDKVINLNIADQDDPPFLLSETAPAKTKYLNRLTGAHILDAALRTLNKDKLAQTVVQESCIETLAKLNQDARQCTGADSVKKRFVELRTAYRELKKSLDYIKQVSEVRDAVKNIDQRTTDAVAKTQRIDTVLSRLAVLRDKGEQLSRLRDLQTVLKQELQLVLKFQEVQKHEAALAAENALCPTCGKPLDVTAMLG